MAERSAENWTYRLVFIALAAAIGFAQLLPLHPPACPAHEAARCGAVQYGNRSYTESVAQARRGGVRVQLPVRNVAQSVRSCRRCSSRSLRW